MGLRYGAPVVTPVLTLCSIWHALNLHGRWPTGTRSDIQGDMGITPALIRQYGEILRQYSRLQLMSHSRVNYKVNMWAKNKLSLRKRGWGGRVEKIWDDMSIREQLNIYSDRERQHFLKEEAMAKHIFKWKNNLEREKAIRGNGKNKLKTYRIFKSNYFTEKYLHIKSPRLRSAMAKFRCGIAPINIEIG